MAGEAAHRARRDVVALQRISAGRWKKLPAQVKDRVVEHLLTVVAAGVAFYAFLALVPILLVIVSIYGLFADPAGIEQQVRESAGALPEEAKTFIIAQLEAITSTSGSSLTITVVASSIVALWSASAGISNLMKGVSVASGATDYRNFVVKRGLAVAMTLGASVFVALSLTTLALLPPFLADTGMGLTGRVIIDTLRFPVVALILMAGLGVLYHYSQPSPHGRPKLITWGTLVATGLWALSSMGLSWYTANFDSYNETYGSLGVVIVVLLWLWLSALTILIGAEVDAELGT
jgi:membrane protein